MTGQADPDGRGGATRKSRHTWPSRLSRVDRQTRMTMDLRLTMMAMATWVATQALLTRETLITSMRRPVVVDRKDSTPCATRFPRVRILRRKSVITSIACVGSTDGVYSWVILCLDARSSMST